MNVVLFVQATKVQFCFECIASILRMLIQWRPDESKSRGPAKKFELSKQFQLFTLRIIFFQMNKYCKKNRFIWEHARI